MVYRNLLGSSSAVEFEEEFEEEEEELEKELREGNVPLLVARVVVDDLLPDPTRVVASLA